MDFEKAWDAAVRLLDERGQLLNGRLFRLVEQNDQLFRQIRTRLIEDGIAEDRFGAGLVRSKSPLPTATPSHAAIPSENPALAVAESDGSVNPIGSFDLQLDGRIQMPDWWLMSGGVIRGPMDLVTLCTLKQQGEIRSADVVRQGLDGFWQRPDEIPLLAALANVNLDEMEVNGLPLSTQPRSRHPNENSRGTSNVVANPDAREPLPGAGGRSDEEQTYVRPEKTWSIKQEKTNWLSRGWYSMSSMVGGPRRLYSLFAVIIVTSLIALWWRQPPASKTIYLEFTQIRASLRRLHEKRAPRSEFDLVSARYRPRVKGIADRLKRVASERHPLENALHKAAVGGLLPMLENPMTPGSAAREFEIQMDRANQLLEGRPANPTNAPR